MNVVFVSHCDFTGNSAMHVFSIANRLCELGVASVVCVPNDPGTVRLHGEPLFTILHHDEATRINIVFPDGRGPDLIHAWTPRELVRRVTQALVRRYRVPYLVHLEDNEEIIVEDELDGPSFGALGHLPPALVDELVADHRSHPLHAPAFLASSAGVTALMDRLLEFKPTHVSGLVFWPGFDAAFATTGPDQAFRRRLGLRDGELMAAYTGNVHRSNVDEARSLVAAVAALRRRGHRLTLVKTGWNHAPIPHYDEAVREGALIDLGFCARDEVPRLVANADVLAQPGRPGRFNDYRFPSKLPEFLVSGKPVVLPRTNIGRFLHDGVDSLLLDRGDALEIAARIETLLTDPEERARLGAAGREFALRELTWEKSVRAIKCFYDEVLGTRRSSAGTYEATRAARDAEIATVTPAPAAGKDYPRLIAFYLPQFHRIDENDRWWGEGFTEWTNVRRGVPSFAGHVQPRVPADLGYYDLDDPEVLERQALLAHAYGVHGFCFYYYWFDGRRLLERPLERFLNSGSPDLPFCVCWANENWTRRWDGSQDEVLVRQEYHAGYADAFMADVIPVLKDPRYITVRGAPILLVYRVDLLPDATAAAARWRLLCARAGIPQVHLTAVQSFNIGDPRRYGFDAAVEFPPHVDRQLVDPATVPGTVSDFEGYLEDYEAVARQQTIQKPVPYIRYRGAMPAWDNSARRLKRAHVCVGSSPAAYQAWLEQVVAQTLARSPVQEPLVFLNAWNEWAEGAFLEPDRHDGRARLEATERALCRGTAAHYRQRGFPVSEEMVRRALTADAVIGPSVAPAVVDGATV